MMRKILFAAMLLCAVSGFTACSSDDSASGNKPTPEVPDEPGKDDDDDPVVDPSIEEWDGEKADDAALDVAGSDEDLYWEAPANDFSTTVTVVYDGSAATVTTSDSKVLYDCKGAYVTVDLQTNAVKNVEIVVRGKSGDGGLKIYGEKKFKLTLAGVELTSKRGPAVNNQCKKRVFVHLAEGSTNRLTDAATYGEDSYYLSGASSATEDRKGCLFSEGHLIFSGTGVLVVEGRRKHAVATDGYLRMRPGVTVAVTGAAGNGVQVKGDATDGIGVHVGGGLLYAHVASEAGKCVKTDLDVEIAGGKVLLNTSGNAIYDTEKKDTSSPSCIKADGDVRITGGVTTLKSTGLGAKGINAGGVLTVGGGATTVSTSGGEFVYSRNMTASPKGVKAGGDIIVNDGELTVSVSGVSDGSEGLESGGAITVNGGQVHSYAYDDAINAATGVTVSGGRVYGYSVTNDGIDSNGPIVISGGVVIASGTSQPEEGFDCDNNRFQITGGIVIGTGGTTSSPTAGACTQRSVVYNGISATEGALLCVRDSGGDPVLVYEFPRTMSGMCLLFSAPGIAQGATYTLLTGGSSTGTAWNGWYAEPSWTGGSQIGSFTATNMVTTVGSGGGHGGRP